MGIVIPEKAVLQIARLSGQTDSTGKVQIDIAVPGQLGQVTRLVERGEGWFTNPSASGGDWIEMHVISMNVNIAPVGTIIGTYTDMEVPAGNQGWFFPPSGIIQIEAQAGSGRLQGGMGIRVIAHRGDNAQGEEFCANIKWGKPE